MDALAMKRARAIDAPIADNHLDDAEFTASKNSPSAPIVAPLFQAVSFGLHCHPLAL
ncbi:MAG: hypothetical protein KF691_00960 [Phycisphaeraceae bacterium]|nr:hypothetical protein [Phycisphaeraceae bacterium]